jgi:hypothetical protein
MNKKEVSELHRYGSSYSGPFYHGTKAYPVVLQEMLDHIDELDGLA